MNRETWIETVLNQVHFAPDRKKIRQELLEHMEDRMEEFEDEERVLQSMGDPTELGKELNREHKPWLGWLWLFSWIFLISMLCLAMLLSIVTGISAFSDARDRMDLEEVYKAKIKYYDENYNHTGDVYFNWETNYSVALLDTEITFRNFCYDDYDGKLVIYITSEGEYNFGKNILYVEVDDASFSYAEHETGLNIEGEQVGVYVLTFERFDKKKKVVTVSYEKFGEGFSFDIDLSTGEVMP